MTVGLLRAALTTNPNPALPYWLLIDQFEELFTQVAADDRAQALNWLADLASHPSGAVRVLVTLRSDFLPHIVTDARFEPYVRRMVVLRAMTEAELQDAIQRPIQACYPEKYAELALVKRLARDAAADEAYLPLLQVTLEDLWRNGSLRLTAYVGLADAIQRRADAVYSYRDADGLQQELRPPEEQQAILDLCLALIHVSPDNIQADVRQRQRLHDLTDGQPTQQALVEALTKARLLRTDVEQQDGQLVEVVDLIHERLMHDWPHLREALADQRQTLQQRSRFRQALQEWEAHDREDDYLLTGVRLSEAHKLYTQWDIALRSEPAQALLAASQASQEKHIQTELQRQRALTEAQRQRAVLFRRAFAVVVVLLVAALIATWIALDRQRAAQSNAAEAESNAAQAQQQRQQAEANAAQAEAERDRAVGLTILRGMQDTLTQDELALVYPLALAAVQLPAPAPNAHLRLALSVYRPELRHTLQGHTDAVTSGVFSPDGQTILSASHDGTLRLWSIIPYAQQAAWLCSHRKVPELTLAQREQYGIPADLALCPAATPPARGGVQGP